MIESITTVIAWMAIISGGWMLVRRLASCGGQSGGMPAGCSGLGCGGVCRSDIEASETPPGDEAATVAQPRRCSDTNGNSSWDMS